MNDDIFGGNTPVRVRTNWERLRTMTDAEVHAAAMSDPDAQPMDEAAWKTARVVRPNVPMADMTIGLEPDVWDWFRRRPGLSIGIDSLLRGFFRDFVEDPGWGPYDTPPWPDDPAWTEAPGGPGHAVTVEVNKRAADWFQAQDEMDRKINAILRRHVRDWGHLDDSDQDFDPPD